MFDDWKAAANRRILRRLDRKPFRTLADELDRDVEELSDCYTEVLLANGIIDDGGSETGADFDEDDLLEAMLERFLTSHPADDEKALLYASLTDAYLSLLEDTGEEL